jgi:hypothetical protein
MGRDIAVMKKTIRIRGEKDRLPEYSIWVSISG